MTKLPRRTASMLTRAMNCSESLGDDLWDDTGPMAQRGTEIHTFMELVPQIGRDEALKKADQDYLGDYKAIDLAQLPFDIYREDFITERRFVLDPSSGKWSIGDHPKDNSCISGQADGSWTENDTAVVIDYKTGVKREKAKHAWQIKFLALGVARKYGLKKAKGMLIYLPGMEADTAEFGEQELNDIEGQLMNMPTDTGFRTGPWCRYCPRITTCPPMVKAVDLVAGLGDRKITNNMLPMIADADKCMATIKSRISKLLFALSFKDITVGGRRFYMDTRQGAAKLDPLTVESVLLNHIPDDVSPSEFGETKYTQASIRRQCENFGISHTAVMDELKKHDALKRERKNNPIEESVGSGTKERRRKG